jgi:collagen type III alpha
MSQATLPSSAEPKPGAARPKLTLSDMVSDAAINLKRVEFAKTVLGVGILVALVGIAIILVDHWVWPLTVTMRWVCLIVLSSFALLWFVRRVLPMFGKTINPVYAAQQIERKVPELKDSLVSYVQLTDVSDQPSKGIVNAVGKFAVEKLSRHDIGEFVASSTPIRLATILTMVIVLSGAYLVLSPKSGLDSLRRLLMPWRLIDVPSRVKILEITPKEAVVGRGQVLPVKVNLQGWLPGDKVQIVFSTFDGQFADQFIDMTADIEGASYRGDLTMGESGIQQALEYTVRAGDTTAGPYRVDVELVPLVAVDKLELVYPKYTQLPMQVLERPSDFDALEGTTVRVYATGNQAMDSGRIEVNPDAQPNDERNDKRIFSLLTEGRSLSGRFNVQLNKLREDPSRGTFRLSAVSTLKQPTANPLAYDFSVTADQPPTIEWKEAYPAVIEVPLNHAIDFTEVGADPDFGLSSLRILLARDQIKLEDKTLLMREEGIRETVERIWRFEPNRMGLRVGDELTIQAFASDNRREAEDSKWSPNITATTPQRIKIVAQSKEETENSKPADQTEPLPPQPQDGSDVKPIEEPNDDNQDNDQQNNDRNEDQDASSDQDEDSKDEQSNDPNKDQSQSDSQDSESNSDSEDKDATNSGDDQNNASTENKDGQEDDKDQSANDQEAGSDSKDQADSQSESGDSETSSNKDEGEKSSTDDGSDSSQSADQKQESETSEGADLKSGDPSSDKSQDSDKQSAQQQSGDKSNSAKQNGEQQTSEEQNGEQENADGQNGQEQSANDQSANKQNGDKQNGSQQNGESNSGEKQNGSEQSGDKQNGQQQNGSQQSGNQSAQQNQQDNKQNGSQNKQQNSQQGNQQAGSKGNQQGDKQAGQQGDKQAGQQGDKQSGQQGDKQSGQQGDKQSGEAQAGNKQQGNNQSGNKQQGSKPQGSKPQGDKQEGGNKGKSSGAKGDANEQSSDANGEESSGNDSQQSPDGKLGEANGNSPSDGQGGEKGDVNKVERSQRSDGEPMHDGELIEEINRWMKDNKVEDANDGDAQSNPRQNDQGEKGEDSNSSKSGDGPSSSKDGNQSKDSGNQSKEGSKPSDGNSPSSKDGSKGSANGMAPADPSSAKQSPNGSSTSKAEGTKADGNKSEGQGKSGSGDKPSDSSSNGSESSSSSSNGTKADDAKSSKGSSSSSSGSSSEQDANSDEESTASDQETQSDDPKDHPVSTGQPPNNNPPAGSQSQNQSQQSSKQSPNKGGEQGGEGSKQGGAGQGASAKGGQGGRVTSGSGEVSDGDIPQGNAQNSSTPSNESYGDEANMEYTEEATDMALDYLQRQRDQPDPELLKRLGWTEDDLRNFVDRWTAARDRAIESKTGRDDYMEDLRSLGLTPKSDRKNAKGIDDRMKGLKEEGRTRAPKSLQNQYDAFRKKAQERAATK